MTAHSGAFCNHRPLWRAIRKVAFDGCMRSDVYLVRRDIGGPADTIFNINLPAVDTQVTRYRPVNKHAAARNEHVAADTGA